MKVISLLILAGSLLPAAQAYIVELFNDRDCQDSSGSRNVYDNTCAYTQGFQSFKITTYGGGGQELRTYSPQACSTAQSITSGCATGGVNTLALGRCYEAYNDAGGSNALSSYSNAFVCGS